jgi:ABC-type dipeptide/oligopeptide/nickel transport system ATPase subunit
MQTFIVKLESEVFKTFRCTKAANSLDIDVDEKSKHTIKIAADLETKFNIGLIVGSSGSGKTTLAKKIYGQDCFTELLDLQKPIIDQLPSELSYDECASLLSGVGLTSVPCWIRPAFTLSNGQRARAEACLQMLRPGGAIIDEWTSVVDRTIGKVMSFCIQKHARKFNKNVVLCSCHYDVIDWLNPDWIIDCNKQEFIDRRSMVGTHQRTDRLRLGLRVVGKETWPYFSKYHYLSQNLPSGRIYTYGIFSGVDQIGFQCFAAYIIGDQRTYFSNRTVVHPDYAGFGLSRMIINESSKLMVDKGFRIKAKFSSLPIYKVLSRDPLWRCTQISRPIKKGRSYFARTKKSRQKTIRTKTTTYHFDFVWGNDKKRSKIS